MTMLARALSVWRSAAIALALACILGAVGPARAADDPIEIFDAHLHYNWEPKPHFQVEEVLALFKKRGFTIHDSARGSTVDVEKILD